MTSLQSCGLNSTSVVLEGTSCTESNFIFKGGVFYATYGGYNHPRKPAPELYEHLTYVSPSLPRQASVDYPPHFYSAQLLHYGLKALKTKLAAKKKFLSLFNALDGRTLQVPKSILEFEETLRKRSQTEPIPIVDAAPVHAIPEIDVQHNKDASGESKVLVSSAKSTVTTPKQTVQICNKEIPPSTVISQPSTTVPTPTNFEASSANPPPKTKQTAGKTIWEGANHEASSSNSATKKKTAGSTVWQGTAEIRSPNPVQTTRQTAGKTVWPEADSAGDASLESPVAANADALSTPASSGKKRKLSLSASSSSSSFGYLEPRMAVKRFKKSIALPQMTDAEIREGIQDFSAVRARQILERLFDKIPAVADILEQEILSERKRDRSSNLREKPISPSVWTGVYNVEAPLVKQEQYGDYRYMFEIYPSSMSKHLWASFDFGTFKGVMRSLDEVPKFLDTEIQFEWRGDMVGRGMTFDTKNHVAITFLPGELFEGIMFAPVYGTYRIYGCRPAQTLKPISLKKRLKKVNTWKSTWRSINRQNFDIGGEERWENGGHGVGEEKEDAYASDTTDGEQEHTLRFDALNRFMDEPEPSEYECSEEDDIEEDESQRSTSYYTESDM